MFKPSIQRLQNQPLAAVAALCFGLSSLCSTNAMASSWSSINSSNTYTAIDVASDTTINPLRGYYKWQGQEVVPQAAPAQDAYRRFHWRDLESAPGVYNFSKIINELNTAKSQGRKFALRVRMMAGYDDGQIYMPAYLVNNPQCQYGCGFWADNDPAVAGLTFVPDWNDPYLQQRARAMLAALGAVIGNDEAISWVDVGMYGQWGEWALTANMYKTPPAGVLRASNASLREFAKMHFDAFPSRQQVMFALYDVRDALSYGLLEQTITSKPVGLRTDCIGKNKFFDWQWNHTEMNKFANQWQKAPYVGEFCFINSGDSVTNIANARQQAAAYHISAIGNGNLAAWSSFSAQEQADLLALPREIGYRYHVESSTVSLDAAGQLGVTATIRNLGTAPTYEPWSVQVELVNGAGSVAWSGSLPINLGSIPGQNTSSTVQGNWSLPDLPTGSYSVRLVARDSRNSAKRTMLKWVTSSRGSDGGLTLSSVINN
ncbi:MAG: hypothetical protein RL748_4594 [Pseudomonadota bacterium]|jgi:hypothetical protein